MAQGVSFGQQVLYQPGAYTKIDASQLARPGGLAFGRVLCIGPALGGKPFTPLLFQDAAEALKTFGGLSPLGQAIALAFQGGVAGGAVEVVGIRCDNAAKASGTAASVNSVTLAAEHKDFGGYGNSYTVSFEPGSSQGARVSVEGTGLDGRPYRRRFDNRTSLSGIVSEVNRNTPINLSIVNGGTQATQTLTLATNQVDGRATFTHVAELATTTGYLYQYPATFLANPVGSLIATYDGTISFAVSAIDPATNILTVTGHNFVNNQRVRLSGDTLPTGTDADTLYFVVGAATNEIQLSLTEGGSPVDISGTVSNCVVTLAPQTVVVTASNPASLNGTYPVAAAIAEMDMAVTDAAISLTAYGANAYRVTLSTGNWGANAVPGRIFTITGGDYAGTYQILMSEYDESGQNRIRIVRKLSTGAISAGLFTGTFEFWPAFRLTRSQPASQPVETLLPANGILQVGGQYLTATVGEVSVYYSTVPGDTIEAIGEFLANALNTAEELEGLVTVAATYNAATYTSTLTVTAVQPGTAANALRVDIIVNPQPILLVAKGGSTLDGGIDPPLPLNGLGQVALTITLSGGYDSAPLFADWLNALEVAKTLSVYWVVPITDDIGVQSAVLDHCTAMSEARRERRAILGHGLGWTPAEIRERSEFFNSGRVIFASPGFRAPDFVSGKQRWYPAYMTAAKVAGMVVAEGIADPITHSYLTGVSELEINYQSGSTELDLMVQSGVLCIEADPAIGRPSRGFRVVRAITTLRDGSGLEGINILTQSDYVAQRVRDRQESQFVGKAITPGILNQMVYETNRELLLLKNAGAIYGFDPTRTRMRINPELQSAVDSSYVIYPSPGLEFVLNSQILLPIPAGETSTSQAV